ncbi:MAG: EamA family transporter, partial [Rhodococcus qingshengii]
GLTGAGAFISSGTGHSLLLLAAGPVTALPLLLFGVAAQRVPLATMGMLQYLTPALQMAWGVAVMHEDMPASRWIGFVLIWAALVIFTTDTFVAGRRSRRSVRSSAEPEVPVT